MCILYAVAIYAVIGAMVGVGIVCFMAFVDDLDVSPTEAAFISMLNVVAWPIALPVFVWARI